MTYYKRHCDAAGHLRVCGVPKLLWQGSASVWGLLWHWPEECARPAQATRSNRAGVKNAAWRAETRCQPHCHIALSDDLQHMSSTAQQVIHPLPVCERGHTEQRRSPLKGMSHLERWHGAFSWCCRTCSDRGVALAGEVQEILRAAQKKQASA